MVVQRGVMVVVLLVVMEVVLTQGDGDAEGGYGGNGSNGDNGGDGGNGGSDSSCGNGGDSFQT